MKKVAEQSSQNLKRNADAFLSSINHDNEKLLWPGGKRIQPDKFVLTCQFKLKALAVKMNKTEKIFHGCFTKDKDGANRLLKKENAVQFRQLIRFGNIQKTLNLAVSIPVLKKKIKKKGHKT